jgi:hypothetical protein
MHGSWRVLISALFSLAAAACGSGDASEPAEVAVVEQALSCQGLRSWSIRPFAAPERVESRGRAYECKPYPFTGWCGLASAYEPGVGFAWQDAWTPLGTCDGAPDASDCSALPAWALGRYPGGYRVKSAGNIYECKPAPYSGWCGIGPAYEPGVGFAWSQAWTLVGPCGSRTSENIDELITTCPAAKELDAVDADFDLRFEFIGDDPAGAALVCSAADGSRDLTHSQERIYQALIAFRALKFDRALPFTNLPLYDWMAQSIDGIRVVEDAPGSSCCAPPPGKTGAYVTIQVDQNRTWLATDLFSQSFGGGLFDLMQLLVHETRHANGPVHSCGGNDSTIAEAGAWAAAYHFSRAVAFDSDPCFVRPFYGASAGFPDPVTSEAGYLEVARNYSYDVHATRFCTEPTDPPTVPEPVTACPD